LTGGKGGLSFVKSVSSNPFQTEVIGAATGVLIMIFMKEKRGKMRKGLDFDPSKRRLSLQTNLLLKKSN
jgi:hypothetical protein